MTKKITPPHRALPSPAPRSRAPAIGRADTALPDKPLKILVGFPAGGGTDVMARVIAEALKQRTGRNIIIDNKAGASGTIAGEALKNSPPDGTTICYMPSATVVQKLTMAVDPVRPADRPRAGHAGRHGADGLLRVADHRRQHAAGIYRVAEEEPDAQQLRHDGDGLVHAFLRRDDRPGDRHPARAGALSRRGAAGRRPAGRPCPGRLRRHHRFPRASPRRQGEGDLHLGRRSAPPRRPRSRPSPSSAIPSLSILGWYVFFAPPKTPPALIEAWGNELRAVLKLPEIEKKMTEFGLDVETSTPAEVSQRMAADFKRWKEILDSIGYKPSQS